MLYVGLLIMIIGLILLIIPFIKNKWESLIRKGFLFLVLGSILTIAGALMTVIK